MVASSVPTVDGMEVTRNLWVTCFILLALQELKNEGVCQVGPTLTGQESAEKIVAIGFDLGYSPPTLKETVHALLTIMAWNEGVVE